MVKNTVTRVTPVDGAAEGTRLVIRLQALGRDVRGVLAARGPEARLVLQRVLGGQRVACTPFREAGRRGYRFAATGAYAGLSNDMRDRDWTPAPFIA